MCVCDYVSQCISWVVQSNFSSSVAQRCHKVGPGKAREFQSLVFGCKSRKKQTCNPKTKIFTFHPHLSEFFLGFVQPAGKCETRIGGRGQ